MGNLRKKKYQAGEGAAYMTRTQALRKLQLSLIEFRHLCILKGIYPREPKKRKVAQRGAQGFKTLYHVKDIQFLASEPMIWKMREFKQHFAKLRRAETMQDGRAYRLQLGKKPRITLDHIVKERYPSFVDALRDLDDCLTLLFLFSTFPSLRAVPPEHSEMCQRLTMEFLHVVIAARALRKVFVSIKGYYFQAELRGETITWIIPHHFSFNPDYCAEVDFKTMAHFVEFYCILLGFVNFRLYHQLNLFYPPKLSQLTGDEMEKTLADEGIYVSERIASLNIDLVRNAGVDEIQEEEQQLDQFAMSDDPDKVEQLREQIERNGNLRTLFSGVKVFVNREVPREPIVFCIRALGGAVSWDKTLFVGSTFDEDDETITHQIVDRPSLEKQYISRYYVQPQWVFDSVNAAELLPIERYLIGVVLPPHLSPFLDETRDHRYKPPEELALKGEEATWLKKKANDKAENSDDNDSEEDEDEVEENEDITANQDSVTAAKSSEEEEEEEEEDDDDDDDDDDDKEKEAQKPTLSKEEERQEKKKKMAVKKGTIEKPDLMATHREEISERKMREKMIRNKHRKLYWNMMDNRKKWGKETWLLQKKRNRVDEEETVAKKLAKKQHKKAAAALKA